MECPSCDGPKSSQARHWAHFDKHGRAKSDQAKLALRDAVRRNRRFGFGGRSQPA